MSDNGVGKPIDDINGLNEEEEQIFDKIEHMNV